MTMPSPVIPAELTPYYDDHVREAHARLAGVTIEGMERYLDKNSIDFLDSSNGTVGFVDIRPATDAYDETVALAVPFPHAAGWDINMALRLRLLQGGLPEPMRVVGFPNNTLDQTFTYRIGADGQQELSQQGSFDGLARQQIDVLAQLGISRVHYMGYSQGASVGAAALRMAARYGQWELGNSGLFEAPNCLNRTPLQLVRDFMATQHFSRTVRESAIPLLSEVQHARGGLDALVQAIGLVELGVSTFGEANQAIRAALGKDRFINDVEQAATAMQDATVTVGAGLKSRIMPPTVLDTLSEQAQDLPRLRVLGFAGYGHEMADNIVAHTLLARAALAGTA